MKKYILAGVGKMIAFTQSSKSPQKIFETTSLQENSINIEVTAEDIRGGLSNPILGRYFHDSMLNATITDALFDLEYIALNVGGEITIGGDSLTVEAFEVVSPNTITVKGNPMPFGNAGTVGWYTVEGDDSWIPITFKGKTATAEGLEIGTKVCVHYNDRDDAIKQFSVSSSIIPAEVHAYMIFPLFAAGSDIESLSSSSKVGELIVDIPRFQFSGGVELNLTSSGASTTNLSGTALAKHSMMNCEDMSKYADIKMKEFGIKWTDNLVALAVDDGDVALTAPNTKTIRVTGIYDEGGNLKTGLVTNTNLTFTSSQQSYASVSKEGVISAASTGDTDIEIKVTDKPEIVAHMKVSVTE